ACTIRTLFPFCTRARRWLAVKRVEAIRNGLAGEGLAGGFEERLVDLAAVAERVAACRPAQAVAFFDSRAGLLARHLLHGVGGEQALALKNSPVQNHLAEAAKIL